MISVLTPSFQANTQYMQAWRVGKLNNLCGCSRRWSFSETRGAGAYYRRVFGALTYLTENRGQLVAKKTSEGATMIYLKPLVVKLILLSLMHVI